MHSRYFGLDEANGLVPLLRTTFERARPVVEQLSGVLQQLETGGGLERNELMTERDALVAQLKRLLEPIESLGIEVKSADGLVDFPALRHEREVLLCWKYPETEVAFWHALDDGYAGRQPVLAEDAFEPSLLC
jgi:hypothetical protein